MAVKGFEESICRLSECEILEKILPRYEQDFKGFCTRKIVEKSQALFLQNEKPNKIHFLCSGKMKQSRTNYSGKNSTIRIFGPVNFLDIASVLTEEKYSFSCYALERSCVHAIEKSDFLRIFESDANFSRVILRQLCADTIRLKNELSNCRGLPGRQNLASLLISLAEDFGNKKRAGIELDILLSRAEMAEMCGMTTEALIRLLTGFKKEGLVEDLDGKRLVVRDFQRLLEISRS